ncbi:energy transducer TonB [Dendrosporobacter sp. 1207_IL3150]|uniref:energy transducer TonB n=1 Tax=Dendrosporobacter sp. 1207_IL3150 TaxID=3084054 RepID=UPI002FDA269E
MTTSTRWRRAVGLSCLFHIFFLLGLGWFAWPMFEPPVVTEQLIELELAAPGSKDLAVHSQSAAAATAAAQSIPVALPTTETQNPQVVAEAMSILAAEVQVTAVKPSGGLSNYYSVENGSGSSATSNSGGGSGPSADTGSGKRGISPPGILSKVEPQYPSSARNAGQQGTVILKIQVHDNGRPGDVVVYSSSGYDALDDAAIVAVKKWRFIPAKDRETGRNIGCVTTLPIVFQLN